MVKRIIITLALIAATATASLAQEKPAGELEAQIQALEQAAAESPENPAALLRLEKAYAAAGQNDKARALLERIIKLRPDDPAAYSELGYLLDVGNDHANALKYHLLAVEKGPGDPIAHINLGLSYYYASRNDDAAAEFNKAAQINLELLDIAKQTHVYTPEEISANISDQVYYLSNIALCLLFTNRPHKALEHLENARDFAAGDANIASLLARTRDGIDAAKKGDTATEEQLLAIRAARDLLNRNDASRAAEIYRELIAAGVNSEELRISAGNAFFLLGAYDEALAQYQKAAQLNAENPAVFFNLAEAYLKLGKSPEAVRSMQKAVELSPSYAAALAKLGAMEADRGELTVAEKTLSRAAAVSTPAPEPGNLLCSIYLRSSRAGQAAAFARRWLAASPNSPDAPACLASALQKTGDTALALETLRRAAASNPGNEKISALLASISSQPKTQAVASAKTASTRPASKATVAARQPVSSKPAPAKAKPPVTANAGTAAPAKAKPVKKTGTETSVATAKAAVKPAKPATAVKQPAKKPAYVSVVINSKSEVTFKRAPAAVATSGAKTEKPQPVKKPAVEKAAAASSQGYATASTNISKTASVQSKKTKPAVSANKPASTKKPAIKKTTAATSLPQAKQKPSTAKAAPAATAATATVIAESASQTVRPEASNLIAAHATETIKVAASSKSASIKTRPAGKSPAAKKKQPAVASSQKPKQKPASARKPATASATITATPIKTATQTVSAPNSLIIAATSSVAISPAAAESAKAATTTVAAANTKKAAESKKASKTRRPVSAKKPAVKKSPASTGTARQQPASEKAPAQVETVASMPFVETRRKTETPAAKPAKPLISAGTKKLLISVKKTPFSAKPTASLRKPPAKKAPVDVAVATAPAKKPAGEKSASASAKKPAGRKPAAKEKAPSAAAAQKRDTASSAAVTAVAAGAATATAGVSATPSAGVPAVAAAKPAVAIKQPVKKKKPAAVITTAPVKQKPAVAVKQQSLPPGELPILPGLSNAVKGQIAAAGINTIPGENRFEANALRKLRSGVTGAWIYQDSAGVIWARKSGGAGYMRVAEGIQPSLTADKKTLVYIARAGSSRMVKALSLTTMASKTVIDNSKFTRGQAPAFFKQPGVSPNGKHLSVLVESGGGVFDLTLRRLDTGTIMRPLPGYNVDYYAWDPSGERIMFASDPCGKDGAGNVSCIGMVSLATGKVTWLDSSFRATVEGGKKVYIGGMTQPVFAFSPSGKNLLMYDADSYSGTVVIADLEANSATRIIPRDLNGDQVDCENFAWAPDGARIAFTSENSVWVMNMDGSGAFPAQQLTGGVSPPFYWLP